MPRSFIFFTIIALLPLQASASDERLVGFWVRTAGGTNARWTLSADGTGVYEKDVAASSPGFVLTSYFTWSTDDTNTSFTYTVSRETATGNGPFNHDKPVSPPKTYSGPYKLSGTTRKLWSYKGQEHARATQGTEGTTIAAGTLDASYYPSSTGFVSQGITIQPEDGKVLSVGQHWNTSSSASDFAISRFNIDGTLDKTFNGTGKRITDMGSDEDRTPCVAVDPHDGRIVVAGASGRAVALVCHRPDGTLDTSFNHTGKVLVDINYSDLVVGGIAIQPDSRIIVVCHMARPYFRVLRFLPNGDPDADFKDESISIPIGTAEAHCVAIQPSDGKIVVGGATVTVGAGQIAAQDYALWRYNTDGSLDTTFNADGPCPGRFETHLDYFRSPDNHPTCLSVAVRPDDGRIVSGGHFSNGPNSSILALVSNNPDGTPDTTFSEKGYLLKLVSTGSYHGLGEFIDYWDGTASSLALTADGKIVVSGTARFLKGGAPLRKTVVFRYNMDGSEDPTFNGDGEAIVDVASYDRGDQLLIQPADGKIVVGGMARLFGRDYSPPTTKKYYAVTVDRVPANRGSVTGTGGYAAGTTIKLRAKAGKGFRFAGWKEKGRLVSAKSPYVFVLKANRTLVAVFEKNR